MSDDCISRQAVQDYIAKYLSQYLYNDVREAVEAIDEFIGELPSVNPHETVTEFADRCRECGAKYGKLLKQEPCEDAISRQAVIDTIESWLSCDDYNAAERHIMRAVQSVLYDSPSVMPQPKTGHWIEHPEIETSTPEYLMFYECSECGDKQCFCKSDIHRKHFCNNCGAKMEVSE